MPFCKDCKHFKQTGSPEAFRCTNPDLVTEPHNEPVFGNPIPDNMLDQAFWVRYAGWCGPNGDHFEAADPG